MVFEKGDNVIVKVNGHFRVGKVTGRTKLKRGLIYEVLLENGKKVDRCSVNKELSTAHIHKGLTKHLNKKQNGQDSRPDPGAEQEHQGSQVTKQGHPGLN